MPPYDIQDFLEPSFGQKGKLLIEMATTRAKSHHKELKTKEKFPGITTKTYYDSRIQAHLEATAENPYPTDCLRKSDLDMSRYVGGTWVTIDDLRERIKKEQA